MIKKRSNVDGFIIKRRAPGTSQRLGIDNLNLPEKFLDSPASKGDTAERLVNPATPKNLDHQETNTLQPQDDHSGLKLDKLDGEISPADKKKTKKRRLPRLSWLRRLGFKRAALICGLLVLLAGGYFGVKLFLAGNNVFDGNLFASLFSEGKKLKTDEFGRSNILVYGTSEDDPGHEGAELTDSIMIASLDQENKNGLLLSIPRDLWVEYGQACLSGYEGKINVAYLCGKENNDGSAAKGGELLEKIVEDKLGIDLQYRIQLNYKAVTEAVDAVKGITVEIDSDDPRGIQDRNFDWKCNYSCYYVNWPNGPAKLNGEQALALMRARNAAGGYGLGGGNFDREQYQQKVLIALQKKALTAGVLANPVAVNGLIDSLGNNVKTNFDASEIKTLIKLAQDIEQNNIKSLSLVDEKEPLVTTGSHEAQSIVLPVLGIYDFSAIQAYIKRNFSNDPALSEQAIIDVLNGSDVGGVAAIQADKIKAEGLTVGVIGNAPTIEGNIKIYDLTNQTMSGTRKKLEQLYGATAINGSLPKGVSSTANFVIIIGTNGVH